MTFFILDIIQHSSIIEILEVWGFQPRNITQNQPHISFSTDCSIRLGIAKPKMSSDQPYTLPTSYYEI